MFFKSGLRLPAFDFVEIVIDYYGLHIAQIAPNGFHKILGFMSLCIALDIVSSITIFRHFYLLMSNGDWVLFFLYHGLVELCDNLPTSIKYWKEEFFFAYVSTFFGPMKFGATADRVVDPISDLSPDECAITERLIENFVKWSDPEELVLVWYV